MEELSELSGSNEPRFVEDQRICLNILPEEIWMYIFTEKFKNKKSTKQNVANSSLYFRELLLKDRKLFLFPDVLSILSPMSEGRKYSIEKLQSNGEMVDIKTGASYAQLMEYFERQKTVLAAPILNNDLLFSKGVLRCRAVCSDWKMGVDELYQSPEMQGIPEFSKDMDPRSMLNTMLLNWHKTQIINGSPRDIMNFWNPPSNPFFGRHVVVCHLGSSFPENQRYFDELLEMLRVFGHEIRYCEIVVMVVDYGSAYTNRSKFLEFLRLLPNLEYLSIQSLSLKLPEDCFGDEPIPRLGKLKVLKMGRDKPEATTALLAGNNHVKSLILSSTDSKDMVLCDLPNLTSFQTEGSPTGERMLENLGSGWKLEKMKVCELINSGVVDTFHFLENNWANTLTDVTLSDVFLNAENQNLQLNLPNVKRFTVTSCGETLDFMLPMRRLEHFEVKNPSESSHEIDQRIQFVGFTDRMQESNIWDFFPELKTIKLHDMRHYRLDARRRFRLYTNEREKYIYYGQD